MNMYLFIQTVLFDSPAMEANPNFNHFEHFDGHAHTQHHTTIYVEVAREIWVWVETYGPKIWRA